MKERGDEARSNLLSSFLMKYLNVTVQLRESELPQTRSLQSHVEHPNDFTTPIKKLVIIGDAEGKRLSWCILG